MHFFPDASRYLESEISIDQVSPQAQVVLREAIMRIQMFRTGFKNALFEPEVVEPSPSASIAAQRQRRIELLEKGS